MGAKALVQVILQNLTHCEHSCPNERWRKRKVEVYSLRKAAL